MSRRLRAIAPPFVVVSPSGARVRTRLQVTDADAAVLLALGTHLGSLASNPLTCSYRGDEVAAQAATGAVRYDSTLDHGHVRVVVSLLIHGAKANGCSAIVVEDLDVQDACELGRERSGRRPSPGRWAGSFRRLVSGAPTATFGDRLVQMAADAGLFVIAVDPAYTSTWGAEHWLGHVKEISADASGHHAAAFVIARRGLGQRARQRRRCDLTPAEHGEKRATRPVVRSTSVGHPAVLSEQRTRDTGTHGARGQSHLRRKTRPAERTSPVDQVAQDRSGSPTRRDSVPLRV